MVSISQEIKWAFERAKKKVIIPWDELAEEVTGLFAQVREGDLKKADIYFICTDLLAVAKRTYDHAIDTKRKTGSLPYYISQIHPGLVKILHNLPEPVFKELIRRLSKYGKSKSDFINAILKSLGKKKAAEWKESLQKERLKQSDNKQRIKERQAEKVHSNIPAAPVEKSQNFDPRQLALISTAGKLAVVKENSVLEFIQGFNGSLKKGRTVAEIVQYGKKLSSASSLDGVVSGWESGREDNFSGLFIPNFKVRDKPISHINTICRSTWADGYHAAGAHHLFIFRIGRSEYAACDQWLSNMDEHKLYMD